MRDFVKELMKYSNDENRLYVEEVLEIIAEFEITSLDGLREYEENLITINQKKVSKSDRINACAKMIDSFIYESDGLSTEELDKRYYLRRDMESGSIEDRTLAAIKYLMASNRYNLFPFSTYLFIIDRKL